MTDAKYAGCNGWTFMDTYYAARIERMVIHGQPKMDYRAVCGMSSCGHISFGRNLSGVKEEHKAHFAAMHPRNRAKVGNLTVEEPAELERRP